MNCFCSAHQDCRAGALDGCKMCAKAYIEECDENHRTPSPRIEALVKAVEEYRSECENPAKDYLLRATRRQQMFAALDKLEAAAQPAPEELK